MHATLVVHVGYLIYLTCTYLLPGYLPIHRVALSAPNSVTDYVMIGLLTASRPFCLLRGVQDSLDQIRFQQEFQRFQEEVEVSDSNSDCKSDICTDSELSD